MKTQNAKIIKCPKCHTSLSVEKLLIDQFQESIRKDLESELQRREDSLNLQRQENKEMMLKLEQEKEDVDELVKERVKAQLNTREESIKVAIRKEVQEEKSKQLQDLEDELKSKSSQLIELNQTRAKMERLSREFEEKEAQIHLQMEKALTERLEEARVSMKDEIQMASFLKVKEKENIIESLKQKLLDATQRIEQGSMQMQGESFELAIEDLIRNANPGDLVEEIKKGQHGFDALQTVKTSDGKIAGSIAYEMKNTKNWSDSFITKIKADSLSSNLKFGLMVIVSKTLPKGMGNERVLLIDGVWITSIKYVADISVLLKFGILKVHYHKQIQKNGDLKANLLYNFLTSHECQSLFNSMMDGLNNLNEMNQEEERKLQALFRKRERQLQGVLGNLIGYYGTIKGISQDAIQDLPMLEFKKAS